MKIKPVIKGALALLIGAIVLKIFLPWWFVTLIIGGVICVVIYKWVIIRTGVNPVWAKRFATAAFVVFLISLSMAFVEQKWPWVAKALDSRQLAASLGLADWLDPKRPVDLEMKLKTLQEALMKAEEQKYIKKIDRIINERVAKGQELTSEDQKIIKDAEEKLKELSKKAPEAKKPKSSAIEKQPQNSEAQPMPTQKSTPTAPMVASPYSEIQESRPYKILIRPDRLSEPFKLRRGGRVCFNSEMRHRDIEVYDAVTEKYLCQLSAITADKLLRGVKFKGPEGILNVN